MNRRSKSTTRRVVLADREMRLVREAIEMVASGGSRRVILAGIRFGDSLLDPARRMALEAGVRVLPVAHDGDGGVDISVERIRE
jgi:hypothetical protein